MPTFNVRLFQLPTLESQISHLSAAVARLSEVRERADRMNDAKLEREAEYAIKDLMEAIRTLSSHAKQDAKESRRVH